MILINKVSPFAVEAHQKDLIECILKNCGVGFISNIVVFYNNHNIVLPKNNKVNLVVKNGYSDYEIIEYCKKIYNDDIFIFANPFVIFNNTLIHVDKNLTTCIKSDDYFIFDKNCKIDSTKTDINKLFSSVVSNSKLFIEKRNNWIKELENNRGFSKPLISVKNQRNIQKYLTRREISTKIEEIKSIPKIDVIIVSVDYNDILPITLQTIPKEFNVTVVTSPDDVECQKLCKQYGIKYIVSERIYENGASFNKGKAINDGINSISHPDWILLLDADIYLQPDFLDVIVETELRQQELYICKRLIISDYSTLLRWKNGENVGTIERAKGYGYFHLFNIRKFGKKNIFPENHLDASFSDLEFRDLFSIKTEIDTFVVHLGHTNQNWTGRKTENFIDINFDINTYFDKIFCINLDKEKQKWQNVHKIFKENHIQVERFNAISGSLITNEEFEVLVKKYNPEKLKGENASFYGHIENKNSLACLLSHLEIIKKSKNKGYKKILIFEDDIFISKNFISRIEEAKRLNWKMIHLGASQFDWQGIQMTDGFYYSKNTLGTFAYALDHSIYDEVIELLETKRKSVDNLLSEIQQKNYGKCFTYFPNIVISDVEKSDIREPKNLINYAEQVKWDLNIFEKNQIEKVKIFSKSGGKKILFLINSNDVGGAEYVSYQHIKICSDLGYRPIVISSQKGMFFNKIKELDVDLYFSNLNSMDRDSIINVISEISRDCEILYNCNYFSITTFIKSIKEKQDFKYYTIAHSDIDWVIDSLFEYDQITDKYIVIHDKIRNELNKKGVLNTRIMTIPNFIDFDTLENKLKNFKNNGLKNMLGIKNTDFVIGMVTRISADKNILDAIRVFELIDKPDIKLLIVGDCSSNKESIDYKEKCLRYINSKKLQDRIIITGNIDNEDVYKYISCFDISINTSPSEGLPISLLECMACGIHCIFPSHGEIPEVLQNHGSVINIKQRKSLNRNDSENYIFSRYSDQELNLFVKEILRTKSKKIDNQKISDYIKFTRSLSSKIDLLDFLYGGHKSGLSFVIRARNEEKNVEQCLTQIVDIADEIIFVDHLSTDSTFEIAFELSKSYSNLKVYKYNNEIPRPGESYHTKIKEIGDSISNYYNFCLSKCTMNNVVKWDADFIPIRQNLIEMISKFRLRNREDKFSLWFTGKTMFVNGDKKYINEDSYYDEFRAYSLKNGVIWEDAIKCEYISPDYIKDSIEIRFEKPCFYEIKNVEVDEFWLRDTLIDKRDIDDFNIINNIKNGFVPKNLKNYEI